MIKVKEFLDRNFTQPDYLSSAELKKNGHYQIDGYWSYSSDGYGSGKCPLYIRCRCNNETITITILVKDGQSVGTYFQTYDHLPLDHHSKKSDEEIIKFISSYMPSFIREEKINKILQ